MKLVLKIISYTGLGLTIIPSILFLMDKIELSQLKLYMLIGVFVWFGSAVFWVGRKKQEVSKLSRKRNRTVRSET